MIFVGFNGETFNEGNPLFRRARHTQRAGGIPPVDVREPAGGSNQEENACRQNWRKSHRLQNERKEESEATGSVVQSLDFISINEWDIQLSKKLRWKCAPWLAEFASWPQQ